MAGAGAHWRGILATLTGRGLKLPAFAGLAWGPVVEVDFAGDASGELRERTHAEIIRRTLEQKPS
jgi:hypothetical protein